MTAVSAVFRLFILSVYVAAAAFVALAVLEMAIHPVVGLATIAFLAFAIHDITRGNCP